MNISSKEELHTTYRSTIHAVRFCLLALLSVLASFIILLASHTQRAMAIDTTGTSVVVHISGPPGQAGFSPALLTIHIYDTVIFVNQSTTPYAVAADDTSFSSPAIPHNQQWSTTFSVLGAHSYHATSTTDSNVTAVGEILVVADGVALLPTPQPQIEATALAIIQAGKHPPDVMQLPTTITPVPGYHPHLQTRLQARLLTIPDLAIIVGVLAFLILLVVLLIARSRRKHHVKHDDDDEWNDDDFSDRDNTHIYQKSGSSTASATFVAQEVQQKQGTQGVKATQTSKKAWYTRLFQAVKARIHKNKEDGDEDYENSEDDAFEE